MRVKNSRNANNKTRVILKANGVVVARQLLGLRVWASLISIVRKLGWKRRSKRNHHCPVGHGAVEIKNRFFGPTWVNVVFDIFFGHLIQNSEICNPKSFFPLSFKERQKTR